MLEAAKAVCAPCPVRLECLDHAIAEGERFGVWGGLSVRERWVEVRRRAGDRSQGKVCVGCGVDKPIGQFQLTGRGGGPATRCNLCRNEYLRPVAAAYRKRKRDQRESVA